MSTKYKYAELSDLKDILKLENQFFVNKESPSETYESMNLFFKLGGNILMRIENNQPIACIEFIHVKNIDERILSLKNFSPLKCVYILNPRRYTKSENALLIHGWIDNGHITKDLFWKIIKDYENNEILGFIPVDNYKALKFYLSLGAIVIDKVSRIYDKEDAHYVLKRKI